MYSMHWHMESGFICYKNYSDFKYLEGSSHLIKTVSSKRSVEGKQIDKLLTLRVLIIKVGR